jgi:hypothetical protein
LTQLFFNHLIPHFTIQYTFMLDSRGLDKYFAVCGGEIFGGFLFLDNAPRSTVN